eukprot:11197681-Lingulodinium_polyedra.AAC.1
MPRPCSGWGSTAPGMGRGPGLWMCATPQCWRMTCWPRGVGLSCSTCSDTAPPAWLLSPRATLAVLPCSSAPPPRTTRPLWPGCSKTRRP